MTITIDENLVSLLIIGFVAGTAAAVVFESSSATNAMWLRNIAIGVVGAFLGAFIFDLLELNDDIPAILTGTITPAQMLIAFVGAAILMGIARLIRR
ncbi:MAG TPA: GlsB/YeaQ/YmgE family stress response membrane protein [Aggregatilineales bacterium]|nr:GlsB/YeaQ/YmgE family stress response membrane protein [Aggregatilineales bacterium]